MKTKLALNSQVHPQEIAIPETIQVHPSVSPKAAALLEGVIEVLMVNPERYDQMWGQSYCGTPCCILGHCAALAKIGTGEWSVYTVRDQLGLTYEKFDKIYWDTSWPEQFRGSGTNTTTQAMAVARIEHFLKTGA